MLFQNDDSFFVDYQISTNVFKGFNEKGVLNTLPFKCFDIFFVPGTLFLSETHELESHSCNKL
mgnify:CR=1 FL=1